MISTKIDGYCSVPCSGKKNWSFSNIHKIFCGLSHIFSMKKYSYISIFIHFALKKIKIILITYKMSPQMIAKNMIIFSSILIGNRLRLLFSRQKDFLMRMKSTFRKSKKRKRNNNNNEKISSKRVISVKRTWNLPNIDKKKRFTCVRAEKRYKKKL